MGERTHEEIAAEIASVMGIPAESLSPTTRLTEIGMDSLEGLQLLIELERMTGLEIDESALKRFTTIQSIVDLVNERYRDAAAA